MLRVRLALSMWLLVCACAATARAQAVCPSIPPNCNDGACHEGELDFCLGGGDCQCGNQVCDPGETYTSCPVDCFCGDGFCDSIELTGGICFADECDSNNDNCGDGVCTSYEGSVGTCPSDCGVCGDGVCHPGENNAEGFQFPYYCVRDCGIPPDRGPQCISGAGYVFGNKICEVTEPQTCSDCQMALHDCDKRNSVWELGAAPSAQSTISPSLVYDSARAMWVWVGLSHSLLLETWEFDGSRWARRAVGTPTARVGRALIAYDSARRRVVLFGGADPSTGAPLGDTWEWDGQSWLSRSPANSPSARSAPVLIYDVAAGKTRLFGGKDGSGTRLDDAWLWDGTNWTPGVSTGLTGGFADDNAVAVYASNCGGVLVYRAPLVADGTNGVFRFVSASSSWVSSTATFPNLTTVLDGAIAYDSARSRLVSIPPLSASSVEISVSATCTANGNWATADTLPTGMRLAGHRMAFDPVLGLFAVGGRLSAVDPNPTPWIRTFAGTWDPRRRPAKLGNAAAAFFAASGELMVLAGVGSASARELWGWNDGWTYRGLTPWTSGTESMAYSTGNGGRLVVYGTGATSSDTYRWDGTSWTLQNAGGPRRSGHAMSDGYTPLSVYFFGGRDLATNTLSAQFRTSTNGTPWALNTPQGTPPSAREDAAMAYDQQRSRWVVFGGRDATGTALSDTWELGVFNFKWVQRASIGPSARYGHAMVYDSVRKRVVLHGGSTGPGETWEWTGTKWIQLPSTGGQARLDGHSLAFDTIRRRALLVGGVADVLGSTVTADGNVWTYRVHGDTCSDGTVCDSGACVDGVCCDRASCGTCEKCNVVGSEGQCVPVAGSDPDSCGGGQTCVVQSIGSPAVMVGVCGLHKALGQSCATGSECASGICTDSTCCQVTCGNACETCAGTPGVAPGFCAPVPVSAGFSGRGDQCGSYVCNGLGPLCPQNCTRDDECAVSHFCSADGSCQPRKTIGSACNIAGGGTVGADCLLGGCRVCDVGAAFCVDGVCCDGACNDGCNQCGSNAGVCGVAAAASSGRGVCGLYVCDGISASCPTSCASDSDCAGGGSVFCIGGQCKGVLPLAGACTQDSQCDSGHCVDGVCCNEACVGDCRACNVVGAEGSCAVTPTPAAGECAGEASCAGSCAGETAASAHCVYPSVEQRCGLCLACNGQGACSTLPPGGVDAACQAAVCGDRLGGECFHFVTAVELSCVEPGLCQGISDEACAVEGDADGTACSIGACEAGVCKAPPPPPASKGCSYSLVDAASSPGDLVFAWLLLIGAMRWRARSRRLLLDAKP